ncbi:STT3 domain-containing protein [Methanobacterium sp.]|uniref:STT3 domain-containing protein n=1 Tax=Methanobacterium sp. TaxID=2164 RepID=UPI003C74B19F
MIIEWNLSKFKPVIIIILIFSIVFFLRVQSAYLPGVSGDIKPYFQDQSGIPYFSEIDSYYNYRMTQDYLDHGYLGDLIIDGNSWDLHSYYPSGRPAIYPPLIVYITAFTYKLVNSLTKMPLNGVAIWIVPFIASLAVIPAYIFIRKITNDYGGITAGILIGTVPAYFTHTFAGFFDTDMFNMIFPLLIVGFFITSILAKDLKSKSIYLLLSSIFLLVYSMAWEGWWYLFYLLFGTAVVYLISNYMLEIKTIKSFKDYSNAFKWFIGQPAFFSLIAFVALSIILLSLYLGPFGFIDALIRSFGASQLHNSIQSTSYPNVYVSVAELKTPTFLDILGKVGGIIPFVFGILSIPWLLRKLKPGKTKEDLKTYKKKTKPEKNSRKKIETNEEKTGQNNPVNSHIVKVRKSHLLYAILLAIWLLIMAFALTQGSRFLEQFSIPVALGAGISVGLMEPYFAKHIKNTRYCIISLLLLIALVAYGPVSSSYMFSNSICSNVDDSMYNSLTWIKDNTPQNTVITSWWDFGHLFTAVADRPVTFDGGSQNTPRAYWVGKALLTNNENLSAGILRMLTSSGDQGYLTLENYTYNTAKSVEILDKILPVDKQAAQIILTNNYNLTLYQAQNVLQYTHPANLTPHVLLLNNMYLLSKSYWWSYFGSWNLQNNTGKGYSYSAQQAVSQQVNGITAITAQNGIVAKINGTQTVAGFQYEQNNQTHILEPHKLILVQDGNITVNKIVSSYSSFSIILVKENNNYLAVILNKELEDSMFTRLYLTNGAGLSKFKLLHKEGKIIDQYGVLVWNVS